MNSAARQLVHIEAGRGVRHVIVDGKVVVRDRQLTTIDEDTIYEAVKAVMPEFRRDFAAISQRVAKLQPYLDRAHRQIMSADLDIERLPFGSN
jgi:guanine deaminase